MVSSIAWDFEDKLEQHSGSRKTQKEQENGKTKNGSSPSAERAKGQEISPEKLSKFYSKENSLSLSSLSNQVTDLDFDALMKSAEERVEAKSKQSNRADEDDLASPGGKNDKFRRVGRKAGRGHGRKATEVSEILTPNQVRLFLFPFF